MNASCALFFILFISSDKCLPWKAGLFVICYALNLDKRQFAALY